MMPTQEEIDQALAIADTTSERIFRGSWQLFVILATAYRSEKRRADFLAAERFKDDIERLKQVSRAALLERQYAEAMTLMRTVSFEDPSDQHRRNELQLQHEIERKAAGYE
jgi:hypothetical protein